MTLAIRKVVVGTDFSEASEHALESAVSLAKRLGATVEVVHAYALPAFSLPIEGAVMTGPAYAAELSDKLGQQLTELVSRHRASGVPLAGHLRVGAPDKELLAFAAECGANLIVVGTHGRTGPAHLLMGSVAERVVRHSALPVLTVRATAHLGH